ncbi:MAG TPA: hypothetical protein VEL74_22150 [Thermoanaerobaculia bacterium]|nr:hypothetical protein [Thermoanaerobaculia bacterium]
MPGTAPYPDAKTAMAAYSWWKSWFTDDISIATRLAAWQTPMSFHYGTLDSQANADRQRAAAGPIASRARFTIHPDRGHTLGPHVLLGPIDEAIADKIADEVAAVRCGQ